MSLSAFCPFFPSITSLQITSHPLFSMFHFLLSYPVLSYPAPSTCSSISISISLSICSASVWAPRWPRLAA